jgi:hypothetical protein
MTFAPTRSSKFWTETQEPGHPLAALADRLANVNLQPGGADV